MSEQMKSSWSASPASSDLLSGAHTTFLGNMAHMARKARKALGGKGRAEGDSKGKAAAERNLTGISKRLEYMVCKADAKGF